MSFQYQYDQQGGSTSPGGTNQQGQGQAANPGQPPSQSPAPFNGNGSANGANGNDAKTTLWMGELEPWIDENFIRSVWYSLGEQVNVKMIRDKFNGSAGYCFVDFTSPQAAAKALALNGTQIPNSNRPFKLNWASGGGLADRRDDRGPEYSIFVGDLGPEVNEFVLVSLFQGRFQSCKSAKIMTDPISGMSRGYGFVRFADEMDQQRALTEMQGVYCGNRPMRISTATPKNKGGNQGMMQQGMGDPNNTTVFVGGLSGYVTEDELRSFFQGFGEITYVKIPPGKGCGFVQFVQRHAAEMAINQMQGYPIGNSRVRLSWGRSQNNSGPAGTPYRPAPPPPVYPSMGMAPQHPFGPYAPLNPSAYPVHSERPEGVEGADGAAAPAGMPGAIQNPVPPTEILGVEKLNQMAVANDASVADRMEADGRPFLGVYSQ
ncbi:hypothetical protein TWF506_000593 [Arthrobotrys conoides]|uniref:RRM domain-containing protein n=1 Tax=Arthrobotrys conoides TaxID=74498 RepID=A0AAN8PQZ1_9PEZI